MLGGENGRSKVYYMQFVQRFQEKQQPGAFALEDLNDENTLRGHIRGSKT